MNNGWCTKCNRFASGNFCSQCGTPITMPPKEEVDCPCCKGTGKITKYGNMWLRYMDTVGQCVTMDSVPRIFLESLQEEEKIKKGMVHDGAPC